MAQNAAKQLEQLAAVMTLETVLWQQRAHRQRRDREGSRTNMIYDSVKNSGGKAQSDALVTKLAYMFYHDTGAVMKDACQLDDQSLLLSFAAKLYNMVIIIL
jgi:hypothetical protein